MTVLFTLAVSLGCGEAWQVRLIGLKMEDTGLTQLLMDYG
jgi:hypothetical protein